MNVGSLCQRRVFWIDVAQPRQQAALRMREHPVGALVVVEADPDGEGQHVMGVPTDRDLAFEVLAGATSRLRSDSVACGPAIGSAGSAGR